MNLGLFPRQGGGTIPLNDLFLRPKASKTGRKNLVSVLYGQVLVILQVDKNRYVTIPYNK